jgi:hypothetical protein
MPFKVETVYDAVVSKLVALYPTKQRLFNPYSLLENPEIVRKDSYGIAVNDAVREELDFCKLSIAREFRFVLIRQFVTLAGKEDGFDAVTKSLLADQQTFLNAFFATDQIGQGDNIDRIDFNSISGIQQIEDGEKKYLFNEITFTITISESVA